MFEELFQPGNNSPFSEKAYDPNAVQALGKAQTAQSGIDPQLLAQLKAQTLGNGPSLSQGVLRQAQDQNLSNQLALAGSLNGVTNPGMALRTVSTNLGAMNQQAAMQAAQARMAEQLAAQQGVASLGQQQQQSNQFNAGQHNQILSQDTASANAMRAAQNAQIATQSDQTQKAANGFTNQLIGGTLNGLGSVAQSAGLPVNPFAPASAASDENMKRDIKPAHHQIREFLDSLEPHEYEYKQTFLPGTAPGKHISAMAQELEKTPVGKQMINQDAAGKTVDYGRGLGTFLAALADMHQRVKALEKK
jgi:hypothetical protein